MAEFGLNVRLKFSRLKETTRLEKLFEDLYDGDPWLDVTLVGTLSKINAQQAAQKPNDDWNSIWEITNHLISWRENVLQRVNGKTIKTLADNYSIMSSILPMLRGCKL